MQKLRLKESLVYFTANKKGPMRRVRANESLSCANEIQSKAHFQQLGYSYFVLVELAAAHVLRLPPFVGSWPSMYWKRSTSMNNAAASHVTRPVPKHHCIRQTARSKSFLHDSCHWPIYDKQKGRTDTMSIFHFLTARQLLGI